MEYVLVAGVAAADSLLDNFWTDRSRDNRQQQRRRRQQQQEGEDPFVLGVVDGIHHSRVDP